MTESGSEMHRVSTKKFLYKTEDPVRKIETVDDPFFHEGSDNNPVSADTNNKAAPTVINNLNAISSSDIVNTLQQCLNFPQNKTVISLQNLD